MSVMDLKPPVPAKSPDYWHDFADITEKDAAEVTQFSASDGHNLTVYEFGAGNRDGVVIVNALNAPFLMMAKLAGELSKRYRVVSWENRGGPYLREDVAPPTTTLSRQAQDFFEIATAKKLESFHTVALCSGAPIIAWAAARAAMPIRSVSLYAPSGAGRSQPCGTPPNRSAAASRAPIGTLSKAPRSVQPSRPAGRVRASGRRSEPAASVPRS